jgi:hypothetical protein
MNAVGMSVRAAAAIEAIRSALGAVDQLAPAERALVIAALVGDLRARSPESVSALTIGPPTEAIRDPRLAGGDR